MTTYEPALYKHATKLYEAMREQADKVDDSTFVWTGGLTHLCNEVVGHGYYSDVVKALKLMECIVQKRRGSGNVPSEWWLTRDPSLELFHSRVVNANSPENKNDQRISDLTHRVNELESRIRGLEAGIVSE